MASGNPLASSALIANRSTACLKNLQHNETFDGEVLLNEPLSAHTTYRIGGPCLAFVRARSITALQTVLELCKAEELDWCTIGKGSNLLVSDEGYAGIVIALDGDFNTCVFDEDNATVLVGAGVSLAKLVRETCAKGYAGMEFAAGTPGSVGGALVMNAGTRDEWIGSRVLRLSVMDVAGAVKQYDGDKITWTYRASSLVADEVVLQALLQLEVASAKDVQDRMNQLLATRKQNQPLEYPSCGSVFKNPEGHSAGALIEAAGLKGAVCGGAQISEKHANFIVNKKDASAQDVRTLMACAQDKVKEQYGIELKPEVRFLGF